MANAIEITTANFQGEVVESDVPVLLDFWAEWCGPCRAVAPVIDEIAAEYGGRLKVGKVLIVNKNRVTALNLHDGRAMWTVATSDFPSGQGVASNNVYYLPLKKGEILAIDIDKGVVKAHNRARSTPTTPGNLVFYEGTVISQTPTEIMAFPQLVARLAQRALPLNPEFGRLVGVDLRNQAFHKHLGATLVQAVDHRTQLPVLRLGRRDDERVGRGVGLDLPTGGRLAGGLDRRGRRVCRGGRCGGRGCGGGATARCIGGECCPQRDRQLGGVGILEVDHVDVARCRLGARLVQLADQ